MAKVFLRNEYVDTLGTKLEKEKVILITFLGELTRVRVLEILEDGIKVELLN